MKRPFPSILLHSLFLLAAHQIALGIDIPQGDNAKAGYPYQSSSYFTLEVPQDILALSPEERIGFLRVILRQHSSIMNSPVFRASLESVSTNGEREFLLVSTRSVGALGVPKLSDLLVFKGST